MFEEYNPDEGLKIAKNSDGEPKRIPIDDRTPYSETHPKYKEKYEGHIKMGVPMFICPQCGKLGRHYVCEDDQPITGIRLGGEVCDICGSGDTYEVAF